MSPVTNKLPPVENLPQHIPFEQALPMVVDPKTPPKGYCDVYIDDIATVTVDLPGYAKRAKEAVPLAIHAVGRPQTENEDVPRDNLVSTSKLEAEGIPTEQIVMLGFTLDTRRLTVALPPHKFSAWSSSITEIRRKGLSTYDQLDTMVGRLTHLSTIVPPILHFLSRIRQTMGQSKE